MTGMRLLFVVNEVGFFLSHRLPLADAARAAGYKVHVAAPESADAEQIRTHHFEFHPVPISRKGLHPREEIQTVAALYRLYRELAPDIIHHVTIKPVLYGGMAARFAGVRGVVNAVTGLGFVFISRGIKAKGVRFIVRLFYRYSLGHPNSKVIFQNPDDRDMFLRARLVRRERTVLIRGSGVDMTRFAYLSESDATPLVILASRMLWDKGVGEFVEAARILRMTGLACRFALVGDSDRGNPAAIPEAQLHAWHDEGVVEWWGRRDDMPTVLGQSHIVCLPSYREGLPKVLIEAAACGRPIVATDVPGCREIVRNGENGYLVPPGDAPSLAAALLRLIEAPELRSAFGKRGRQIAEDEFSIERVVRETLAIYTELLA